MRLRLEDETRLTIRINGEYNTKINDYTYDLAEDLPAGLGPEAFIGAIVEMRMPVYDRSDPDNYWGYKLLYGHVTSVAKETDADKNDATAQITCKFTMDIGDGFWASSEYVGCLEYYPEGNEWTGEHASIYHESRERYIELRIDLTKTVDETSGDVTYDGTLTTHYDILFPNREPYSFDLRYTNGAGKKESWTTYVTADKMASSYTSATIRLARYLDYDPTEVIINESKVTQQSVKPDDYLYVYHLNFTVPAAKVKPGY